MQGARMLGNYVEYLMSKRGLTHAQLSQILGCNLHQTDAFLKGRAYASFQQISTLAEALGTTVPDLLAGNIDQYNASVVHCMNDFQNVDNREFILDLIDDYVDVVDAVETQH